MQISATGIEISGTDYTWQQSLRFFVLGAIWATAASLPPILWTLYYNYENYSEPIDWALIRGMTLAAVGPALLGYWQKHKALLKVPPYFKIPTEFHPDLKKVEHEVETVIPPASPGDPKVKDTVKETHFEPFTGTGTGDGGAPPEKP